ncbi:MAG TPA: NADH-quinone oxidoreductase subunit L [Ktedonobacterales bacterium]|nr:NADH-quinone oxidoreductase subunit L [Ktedonobacterales bacterium]
MSGGLGVVELAGIFWLAPLLPLAGFATLALGLSRFGRSAGWFAVGAVAGALLCATLGLAGVVAGASGYVALPWLSVGGRSLSLALELTPLTALVGVVVALVGLVILLYSLAYMAEEPLRGRFFAEMCLFLAAMLALVLAGDLITLFIAWELVGLCSYLLIGYWFDRPGVPAAATKAFLTTRLADLGLLLGVLLLIGAVGTGRISVILAAATSGRIAAPTLTMAALLVVWGAAGKSAQLPFSGWLPDAMVGPTPVSALLHSATMVAAGVFLVARLLPLLEATRLALGVVAWLGALTALFAALVALAQTDLKRLLAYSSISQIGLMFVGLGAGSLLAGVLLLVAHALYKATLFLGAGAAQHAVGGTGFERMGGLWRRMPLTFAVFAVAAAALAGLPVTLALPPKDPTLAAAAGASEPLFWIALAASLGTALYSARAVGMTFLGAPSAPAAQAKEAPRGFLAPMLALGGLIIVGLTLDSPLFGAPLERLLGGVTPEAAGVTALTLAVAALGVFAGLAARLAWPGALQWPFVRPVVPLLTAEFGLRPLYRTVAAGGLAFSRGVGAFDRAVFDRIATVAAHGLLAFVHALQRFDLRRVDGAFDTGGQALLAVGRRARRIQTGLVGNYLLAVFTWGLGAAVVVALWLIVSGLVSGAGAR